MDDNDARIDNHETRINGLKNAVDESFGALLNQRKGNYTVPEAPTGYVGYIPVAHMVLTKDANNNLVEVLESYIPPVDALAFVQTRCSFDGDSAGQILEHRAAIRSNKSNSQVVVGGQYYLRTRTPAANISVQDVNSDYFKLKAGVPYDFGVYFFEGNAQFSAKPTPKGGINEDFCSAVVMIFTRNPD